MRQTCIRTYLRRVATVAIATSGIALMAPMAQANEPIYSIDLNKTQILRLPSAAGAIVVGNPAIADVNVHSPMMLFVVGRGFGETNLIVLDRNGNTMVDADIQVTSMTPSHGTRIFNGSSRESYSCVPYCQPSPVLGDDAGFIGENSVEVETDQSTGTIFEDVATGLDAAGGLQGFDPENAEALVADF